MRRARRCGERSDHGQVLPLVAVVMLLAGVTAVAVVAVGEVLVDRAAARTAADAAALAAAAGSDDDAAAVAESNGAELVSVLRNGDQVEVLVRRGRATARARAEATRGATPRAARSARDPIP